MAWETTYRCDRCQLIQEVRTMDYRFYMVPWQGDDFPDMDRVSCSDQEVWCHQCNCMRTGEQVPSLKMAEIMREKAPETGNAELIRRMENRLRWRRERVSPAKCLTCGSTRIERIEGSGFQHPGCGGAFRVSEQPAHINSDELYLIPAEGPAGSE